MSSEQRKSFNLNISLELYEALELVAKAQGWSGVDGVKTVIIDILQRTQRQHQRDIQSSEEQSSINPFNAVDKCPIHPNSWRYANRDGTLSHVIDTGNSAAVYRCFGDHAIREPRRKPYAV